RTNVGGGGQRLAGGGERRELLDRIGVRRGPVGRECKSGPRHAACAEQTEVQIRSSVSSRVLAVRRRPARPVARIELAMRYAQRDNSVGARCERYVSRN